MARPIRIPIVSDVSGFIKGTSDVERALDDVSDSLDDLTREAQGTGDDAGRALSDGIEDGARDAERALDDVGKSDGLEQVGKNADEAAREVESATERMERSFKDAFDGVKKESRDAGRKVGDDVGDGFDRAKEGASEFKDEANSTARESAASFDGSAASITDAFQEIAANAFAGFGPAGAAAGLGIAAGIGLATSAFDKAKERAQELRDRVGEIRDGFLAVKVDGESALSLVADRMREIVTESDPAATNLDKLADAAKGLSEVDFRDFLAGVAGDPAARERAIELAEEELRLAQERDISVIGVLRGEGRERAAQIAIAEQRLELLGAEQTAQEKAATDRHDQAAQAIADDEARAAKTEETNARIEELRGTHDERLAAAREKLKEDEQAAQEARVDAALAADQAIAEDVTTVTSAWQEHFTKISEDNEITIGELNDSLDQMIADQTQKIENWTWAQANLTREQMIGLEQFGEQKHEVLDTLINTPPEARQEALNKLQTTGSRMGQAEGQGFIDGLDRTLPETVNGPRVRIPGVDDSQVQRWIDGIESRTVYLDIEGRVSGRQPV